MFIQQFRQVSVLMLILLAPFSLLSASVLQDAIDKAPSGSILKLPAGVYKGSIVINKPITIIGKEKGVVIDGEGKGTVITAKGSFITKWSKIPLSPITGSLPRILILVYVVMA